MSISEVHYSLRGSVASTRMVHIVGTSLGG